MIHFLTVKDFLNGSAGMNGYATILSFLLMNTPAFDVVISRDKVCW